MKKEQILENRFNQNQLESPNLSNDRVVEDSSSPSSPSRRRFLGNLGGITAATITGSVFGLPSLIGTESTEVEAAEIGPLNRRQRRKEAFRIRKRAALFERRLPLPDHPCNGDEELFPNKIGSYSKGLPHDDLGEVDLDAYNTLIEALSTGQPDDFENIPLGGVRKLANPQAALAFELEGPDPHHLAIPPAPAFSSAEEAGEAVELYWMAILHDVPFTEYNTDPLANAAASELSSLSDFRGPKVEGQVTPATLFRANIPGTLVGPYISQFLWKDVPFGALTINQRMRTVVPGVDYLTRYGEWLASQNGATAGSDQFDPTPRYIRNGRDLCQYVHVDVIFEAYFNAMLILLGMRARFDPANPYNNSRTQFGVGTFGNFYIASVVPAITTRALKAVWFQKWLVHRRLRPEEFGGRIHNHVTGAADYPIHLDILNSLVLDEVFIRYGTYLLPQAFPDGCPLHTSYGGGHATVAGACVTILKAFFDESLVISNPVVASADGLSLEPYVGPDLTVGGELNKLAANIAIGRNIAGIHWRSDAIESLKLGEEVAIRFLREEKLTFNEDFDGFSLTKFDGTTITV